MLQKAGKRHSRQRVLRRAAKFFYKKGNNLFFVGDDMSDKSGTIPPHLIIEGLTYFSVCRLTNPI